MIMAALTFWVLFPLSAKLSHLMDFDVKCYGSTPEVNGRVLFWLHRFNITHTLHEPQIGIWTLKRGKLSPDYTTLQLRRQPSSLFDVVGMGPYSVRTADSVICFSVIMTKHAHTNSVVA
jgi:hypothetical protein